MFKPLRSRFLALSPFTLLVIFFVLVKMAAHTLTAQNGGYTIAFQMKALHGAGFINPTLFWKEGLRAGYGGMKPAR